MSLKRRFCVAGKLKILCIRYVSDWQKKYKNILVSIEKEKQKLTLLLCICIVLILLKYLVLILVTDFFVSRIGYFLPAF